MTQQIIIPWRESDCKFRKRHFDFLYKYYSEHFNVIVSDNNGEFNRSAARNYGVKQSDSDVSVIIDADNYIPINQIFDAIDIAKKKSCLVKPFAWFGYLTEESTNMFYDIFEILDFEPTYINPPENNFTGGAYVIKKDIWLELGGMDEGFVGWGAEDDAFHLLCKNNGIRIKYTEGYDYHLYHPAYRVTSEFNYNKLVEEYVNGNKSSRVKTLGRQ